MLVAKDRDHKSSRQRAFLRWIVAMAAVLAILATGVAGGIMLDRSVLAAAAPASAIAEADTPEFKLLAEAWNSIEKNYVDHALQQPRDLMYGAISGMVESLNDTGHSRFLTPEMVKEEDNFTRGQFDGIGAEVAKKDGQVVIVAPLDGSPAQKAGLHSGEAILKVDGQDVSDLPLDQVVQRIVGQPGTQVTLTIFDPVSGQTQDITLQRAHITVQNVTWHVVPGTTIAHLRLASFSQGVSADLQKALTAIKQQGVTGIILDMRNNPGGLLDEAVGTASQFLSSGNVLLQRNAQGEITPVPVKKGYKAPDLPMIVLVNQGTASAAEIVSGALQDAKRATLVGETTFGTGTVLNQFDLSDGSAILLATQEWRTPNGRVIWHNGIAPDETVVLPATATPLLPEEERTMTQANVQSSGDTQMLKALAILAQAASAPDPGD
jgi:carboxyl-terminal processing protease